MQHLRLRESVRLAAAFVGVRSLPRVRRRKAAARQAAANGALGTTILPFGRYFARPRRHADPGRLQDARPNRRHFTIQRGG